MTALIDGAAVATRDELHDALKRQLALPDWYGRNLDALYDCLTDIREDTEIRLVHADELSACLGAYAGVLQTVLRDAADENPRLRLIIEEE